MVAKGATPTKVQCEGIAGSAEDIDDIAVLVKGLRTVFVDVEPHEAARAADADVDMVVVRQVFCVFSDYI